MNGLGIAADAQRNRHGFRGFTGLIWESLLSDSVVFRSQVGFIMVPQHMFPTLCTRSPETCNDIPSVVQTFPRRQVYGNMDSDHERLNDLWADHPSKLELVYQFLVQEKYWFGTEPSDPGANQAYRRFRGVRRDQR